ncbi:MAG: epoxyqueuosine reductase [Deltaproteobacteria bacterium]|nr:epoxyqueuosine reductase [Deltaproteobacteria bacterium]
MVETLTGYLNENRIVARFIHIDQITQLRKNISDQFKNGLFDKGFYESYLGYFTIPDLENKRNNGMKSVVLMAVKAKQVNFIFSYNEKKIPVVVPPIYIDKNNNCNKADDLLTGFLKKHNKKFEYARIPQKLLATSCGIAKYGKNNIAYIPDFGSYFDLVSYYTDVELSEEEKSLNRIRKNPEVMDRCKTCKICIRSCPSCAITEDRFLLHAEKCITYHNEQDCGIPFPAWMEESWHNCLIGCNICQKVCPENKKINDFVETGCEFTEKETELFLKNTPIEKLPESTREKIDTYKLKDNYNIYDLMPRNLSALLNNHNT